MNYKLIKKLPFENSPEIGYISKPHSTQKNNIHYWNHSWFNPEEHPEFWEKVKDYEILSIKYMNNIYKLSDQNIFRFNDGIISLKTVLNKVLSGIEIYSIKRLSDNEIFTIGGKVRYNFSKETIIKTIEKIAFEKIGKCPEQLFIYSNGEQSTINNYIKVKTPLFQTEDKVDIFESDSFYIIDNWNIEEYKDYISISEYIHNLKFSTKEKAEEYILLNKPCLSYNEVLNAAKIRNKNTFDSLKELIKQKLK